MPGCKSTTCPKYIHLWRATTRNLGHTREEKCMALPKRANRAHCNPACDPITQFVAAARDIRLLMHCYGAKLKSPLGHATPLCTQNPNEIMRGGGSRPRQSSLTALKACRRHPESLTGRTTATTCTPAPRPDTIRPKHTPSCSPHILGSAQKKKYPGRRTE